MSADLIHCYLHAKHGFVLVPTAQNVAGIWKSIDRPQVLAALATDAQLGAPETSACADKPIYTIVWFPSQSA